MEEEKEKTKRKKKGDLEKTKQEDKTRQKRRQGKRKEKRRENEKGRREKAKRSAPQRRATWHVLGASNNKTNQPSCCPQHTPSSRPRHFYLADRRNAFISLLVCLHHLLPAHKSARGDNNSRTTNDKATNNGSTGSQRPKRKKKKNVPSSVFCFGVFYERCRSNLGAAQGDSRAQRVPSPDSHTDTH